MITASVMTSTTSSGPTTQDDLCRLFCDISAFFNCDSSAYSEISQIMGIPLGFFGMFMGLLIVLGAVFPSEASSGPTSPSPSSTSSASSRLPLFRPQARQPLLLCSGFYLFSIFNFILFWIYGIDHETKNIIRRWVGRR